MVVSCGNATNCILWGLGLLDDSFLLCGVYVLQWAVRWRAEKNLKKTSIR